MNDRRKTREKEIWHRLFKYSVRTETSLEQPSRNIPRGSSGETAVSCAALGHRGPKSAQKEA